MKKTQIKFVFELHTPDFVERMRKPFEEADVILAELPPRIIESLVRGVPPKKLAKFSEHHPEFAERYLILLKEMSDKGKTVVGTRIINPRAKRLGKQKDSAYLRKNYVEAAKIGIKRIKIRERDRLRFIKNLLPAYEGKKIFIEAGSGHIPLYYQLKRELGEKADVSRVSLARGRLGAAIEEHLVQGMTCEAARDKVYFELMTKHAAKPGPLMRLRWWLSSRHRLRH